MDNDAYMAARVVSSVPMPDEEGVAQPEHAQGEPSGVPRHDDTLGEEVPPPLADQVLASIRDILRVPPSASGNEFLGSQPVSLARANAGLLAEPDLHYCVSWKADGTRYLMLLLHGGAYLVDRAARVRRCQMRFPAPAPPMPHCAHARGRPDKPAHGTLRGVLLDGEMVVDVTATPAGPTMQRRFLVYDCISAGAHDFARPPLSDKPMMERPFMRIRYDAIEACVVTPKREYEQAAAQCYRANAEPFRVRRKDFYGPERAPWLLGVLIPALTHPSDGLVFQPGAEPYRPRTNEHLLKWKLPRLNSVDFYVHEDDNGDRLLCVTGGGDGHLKVLRDVALPASMLDAGDADGGSGGGENGGGDSHGSGGAAPVSPLTAPLVWDAAEPGESDLLRDQCIAECVWDGPRGCWSLLRVRQDKQHPNHESVFVRVWQSIRDNLRDEDVLRLLEPAAAARKAKHEQQELEQRKRKRGDVNE
jgi:mRNA-capping enzyme